MYIELHAASAFSFLQGASLPETLVERAATLGYPALALLDADGVYGAPRFHKAARQAGLRAIIGAELTIQSSQPSPSSRSLERIRPRPSSPIGFGEAGQSVTDSPGPHHRSHGASRSSSPPPRAIAICAGS